jgi:hypothetical protein
MGGYGSGRSGGRPTTESGLTLTLSKLFRDGLFRPGCAWGGSIVWTYTSTGERVGSIGYEAHLGPDSGRVRLKYTTTRWDGEKRESDYWIQLETTPQPFGGRRWWFICPRTGRRAAKLHLPNGAFTFATPCTIAYAPGVAMPRQIEENREAMPIAGGACLPDAWGRRRGSQGQPKRPQARGLHRRDDRLEKTDQRPRSHGSRDAGGDRVGRYRSRPQAPF